MQISQFSYTAYRFGAKQSDVECRSMLICLSSLTHDLDAHDTLNKLPKKKRNCVSGIVCHHNLFYTIIHCKIAVVQRQRDPVNLQQLGLIIPKTAQCLMRIENQYLNQTPTDDHYNYMDDLSLIFNIVKHFKPTGEYYGYHLIIWSMQWHFQIPS